MTKKLTNPVTDNVGAGVPMACVRVISVTPACEDSYYGDNPPIYREMLTNDEQGIFLALKKAYRAAKKEALLQNGASKTSLRRKRGYGDLGGIMTKILSV